MCAPRAIHYYVVRVRLCYCWQCWLWSGYIRGTTMSVATRNKHTHTHILPCRWCGPCRDLGPILREVAMHWTKYWLSYTVDVDALGELSIEYGVTALPTVVAISNGEVADHFVGARNKDFVQKFVKNNFSDSFVWYHTIIIVNKPSLCWLPYCGWDFVVLLLQVSYIEHHHAHITQVLQQLVLWLAWADQRECGSITSRIALCCASFSYCTV